MRWLCLLVLAGCGPDKPGPAKEPPVPLPAIGRGGNTLRGTLIANDKGIADVPLELCGGREGNLHDPTPCARSPRRRVTRTDVTGVFVFDELPDGNYQIFPLEVPYLQHTLVAQVGGNSVRELGRQIMGSKGPAAPAEGGNTVTGILAVGERKLDRVAIALCSGRDDNLYAAPCTAPRTRTDVEGGFTFANVADGTYRLFTLELPYYTHPFTTVEVKGNVFRDLGTVAAQSFAQR